MNHKQVLLGASLFLALSATAVSAQIGNTQPPGSFAPGAVRAATQSVRITAPEGFVLNTTPRPDPSRAQNITFNHNPGNTPRWLISIPYSFMVEGLSHGIATCQVMGQDTDRTILASGEQSVWFNGHGTGTIIVGVPMAVASGAPPAGSYVCTIRLAGTRQTGPRAGIDWEARDTTPLGGPVDAWVREDGYSQWWTGPGFDRPFRLRVSGTIR